jgi:hypothetical protein
MELEEGETVLTANHQVHAARKHPDEYPLFLPHIAQIIAFPLYIGDDFKNSGKIELIGRIPVLGTHVLIAVNTQLDKKGRYKVSSFYSIKPQQVESRKAKGYLKIAILIR